MGFCAEIPPAWCCVCLLSCSSLQMRILQGSCTAQQVWLGKSPRTGSAWKRALCLQQKPGVWRLLLRAAAVWQRLHPPGNQGGRSRSEVWNTELAVWGAAAGLCAGEAVGSLWGPPGPALCRREGAASCPKPSSSLTRCGAVMAQHPAPAARGNWDRAHQRCPDSGANTAAAERRLCKAAVSTCRSPPGTQQPSRAATRPRSPARRCQTAGSSPQSRDPSSPAEGLLLAA